MKQKNQYCVQILILAWKTQILPSISTQALRIAKKTSQYRIVVETIEDKQVGEISLDMLPIISNFTSKGISKVSKTLEINNDTSIEAIVFVEKTK